MLEADVQVPGNLILFFFPLKKLQILLGFGSVCFTENT